MVLVVAIIVPVNFSGNNGMWIDQVITTVFVWLIALRSQMEEEWQYWSSTSYLDLQYFLKGIFNTMKSMELYWFWLVLYCSREQNRFWAYNNWESGSWVCICLTLYCQLPWLLILVHGLYHSDTYAYKMSFYQ